EAMALLPNTKSTGTKREAAKAMERFRISFSRPPVLDGLPALSPLAALKVSRCTAVVNGVLPMFVRPSFSRRHGPSSIELHGARRYFAATTRSRIPLARVPVDRLTDVPIALA